MSGRQSAVVEEALRRVASGETPYAVATECGIAYSTIYRALKRQRDAAAKRTTKRKGKR